MRAITVEPGIGGTARCIVAALYFIIRPLYFGRTPRPSREREGGERRPSGVSGGIAA
ncbi:MAG TPA: hypothetical protein PLG75_10545 [Methanoculleus sp.]|nr:hypothetical protein [Methanoculleus sp.]